MLPRGAPDLCLPGWRLIRPWQGHDLPFRPLWAITWISNFFSLLLPGGIGRDISRGVYLARFRIGPLEIARSILTDRFIGLVSVVVLSVPCMIFALQSGGALHVLGWLLLLLCVGLPVGLWLCHWLDRRYYGHKTAASESRVARVVHAVAAILRDFRSPRLFGIPFLQSCAMMAATTLCVMAISGAIGGFAAPLWSQPLFLPVIFLLSHCRSPSPASASAKFPSSPSSGRWVPRRSRRSPCHWRSSRWG